MRIQHNIPAMSAYRNYSNNVSSVAKNLEKLSSGYKINRAGDDAAGLAISEKMRAQISGLEQAQNNAKSGINLVQTAEGALTEVHDMLNRMYTLAEQSANGTYDNEVDRVQLQKEVDQLRDEINRIADSANFNGINLLDGSMSSATSFQPGKATIDLGTAAGGSFIVTSTATKLQASLVSTVLHKDKSEPAQTTFEVSLNGLSYEQLTTGDVKFTVTVGGTALKATLSADADAAAIVNALKTNTANSQVKIGGVSFSVDASGDKLIFTMNENQAKTITKAGSFTGNFAVSVGIGAATEGVLGNKGNVNLSTVNVQEGSPNSGKILANTVQNTPWTCGDIKDGMVIKIGDESYIMAISDKTFEDASAVANTDLSYKVVDLRELAKDKTVDDGSAVLDKDRDDYVTSNALAKLTEAAKDNKMWSVGLQKDEASNGAIKLTFQEKDTYSGDADLTTLKGIASQFAVYNTNVKIDVTQATKTVKGKALMLQIGDTAESFNKMTVDIKDMHTNAMGIGTIDISSQNGASDAMKSIKDAINYVSDVRGDLGATQNRLDHTINNLSVMQENIQDAESTIRDVDIAKEMMAYTKNNILVQSAQAMLAQANQLPQGVLQLLG